MIWKGSEELESAAERLSKHYGLPVAVHGAVVVVVGSSFSELTSVVVSTLLHGEFSLGVGAIFDTPSFFWGLTVIAVATSLPDTFISVRAARQNDSVTSLTNVLGSNTFNLLVAIPIGILLAGATTINFLVAVPLMAFLGAVTLVFVVFARTGLVISNPEAYASLGLYASFLIWMGLETAGVLQTVQGV